MSENDENIQPQASENSSVANKNSMRSTTEKLKNFTSKFSKKKAGSRTTVKILSKILVSGGWVILVVIVLIGIIMFFLTMPGLVMEKLKGLFKAVANAWSSFWGGDDTAMFEEVEIFNVLNYLDEMGYDLKGYGFVTDFLTKTSQYRDGGAGENLEEQQLKTTTDGVIRSTEDNRIVTGTSEFINAYLISENYIYTIKNFNVVANPLEALWEHAKALVGAGNMQKRRGMLAFYHDGGIIGNRR